MTDIFKIIKEDFMEIVKLIKKHIVEVLFLIQFAETIFLISFNVSKLVSVIILTSSFIILSVLIFLSDKIKKASKYKFRPKKRFTQKNEVGDISVDESRIHQAIIYLSILEDEIW